MQTPERAPSPPLALDLREANLRGGRFAGADLADADLRHATLALADFSKANLRGARLTHADLTLANLCGADLRGADLSGADLSGADLRNARLQGADLGQAELGWARVQGAKGLPASCKAALRQDGRMAGPATAADADEPSAGLLAYQRGAQAHRTGDFAVAEQLYAVALAWVPDSDAVHFALGCLALERGDPAAAQACWRVALDIDPAADRARIGLAWLLLGSAPRSEVGALLSPLLPRFAALSAALSAPDAAALPAALQGIDPQAPAARWFENHALESLPSPPPAPQPMIDDLNALDAEKQSLLALLGRSDATARDWHEAIARSLRIGALDLAQRAEQRLGRLDPEEHLWAAELQHLDQTSEAFEALVRTRATWLGSVQRVQWVALGVHGPTARVACEQGVFFAKRYYGAVRPAASIAFTHRISSLVSARGIHLPLPLPDSLGAETLDFDGDLLALCPDLQGQPLADADLQQGQAIDVGALLGSLHLDTADLAIGSGRPAGGVRAGSRILRQPLPSAAWLAALGLEQDCVSRFQGLAHARLFLSLLDLVGLRLRPLLAQCPRGLVHGDFTPSNILQTQQGYAVCDWDLCDADLWVWDLARCIDRIAVRWPAEPGRPAVLRGAIMRALLRGYESRRPLLPAERAALPLLIAASRVDIDASVLPLSVPYEPATLDAVFAHGLQRLSRAAAGAPEVADALVAP